MIRRSTTSFLLLLIFTCLSGWAQYNPLQPPNTFDSQDNPLYWKNRKPHAAYWQQDVAYDITASLDDEKDLISGTLALTYTNNSPDTLQQLVFHLYQNAFTKGSYASEFNQRFAGKKDTLFQGTEVSEFTVNAMKVETKLDNTLLFIDLTAPLMPGEKAVVECKFQTQFGPINGRMKMYNAWGFKHYNVVHWYPRISVYDRKFGWTTDQHLGHEFYGDFGSFDVMLDLPAHYVMDGTGFLLNRAEVLPASLMEKLNIENFKDKPWNESPSEVIPKTEKRKAWKFHAENVHDFAWTADPTYRIGTHKTTLNNGHEVTCYALAQEPHASGWQNAAEYASKVIEVYSRDIGPYAYHKMIVADARDGMEYPMLTLDGGRDPRYRGLLAHEIGHNWFFGMVGNNETYRASLDEGFTQFLTAWALTELEGDSVNAGSSVFGIDKPFREFRTQRDASVYDGYYFSSVIRDDSPRLNTHSDRFDTRRQYGQVYSKTGTMLYNLQYVLGDELFLEAMQHYFDQWKFCHPYFGDFRSSIIGYTGTDLNWFFDQWLESTDAVDYKVKSVKRKEKGLYEVGLQRKGMQMPLDLSVTFDDGSMKDYHIPNTYFQKKTDAEVLDKWYGWNDFNDTYTFKIESDVGIDEVEIDPSKRLADVYQLDNSTHVPISIELNDFQWTRPHQEYEVEWYPNVWYNGYDGLKVGLELTGDYALVYHKLELSAWVSTGLGQQSAEFPASELDAFNRFNYTLSYSDPLRGIGEDLSYTYTSKWLEGLFANRFYFNKGLNGGSSNVLFGFGGLYRPSDTDLNYLLYSDHWNADRWNNYTEVKVFHSYRYGNGSTGNIRAEMRSPFLFSDYEYGYLNLEVINDNKLAFLNWRTRAFGQFGAGTNWAPESQLFAAGANPEEMMQNALTRSMGYLPTSWYGYGAETGNFQAGGGLNLRGYNNYLLPEYNEDSLLRFGHVGQSGLAFNTEIEFDDAIRILPQLRRFAQLKTYLFADAGIININRTNESWEWSSLRADAGVGATLEIDRWGKYSDLKPVKIRFDMPLFLNRPPAGEEYLQFRWLLGFERAF